MNDLKDLSFLVYGLGLTGKSVVKFFNKNRFKNYKVWDDANISFYNKKVISQKKYKILYKD